MCISDWSSDVCYSDLKAIVGFLRLCRKPIPADGRGVKPSELIGAAGATSLRQRLGTTSDDDGVARFLLDRLSGEQVAAIAAALLQDPATDALLKIAIPRALVTHFDLPEHVLTDERTTHVRNAERAEERRVGKECGSTCRSRWSRDH